MLIRHRIAQWSGVCKLTVSSVTRSDTPRYGQCRRRHRCRGFGNAAAVGPMFTARFEFLNLSDAAPFARSADSETMLNSINTNRCRPCACFDVARCREPFRGGRQCQLCSGCRCIFKRREMQRELRMPTDHGEATLVSPEVASRAGQAATRFVNGSPVAVHNVRRALRRLPVWAPWARY